MSDVFEVKKLYDIFVSYNQKSSKETVDRIVNKLEREEKFKVWIDHNSMNAGTELYKKMEEGLRQSNMVLCFITKEYCKSENCRRELSFTVEHKMKRIFIILDPDLDKQNLEGVGIIIAGSLRFNAFKPKNTFNPWCEDLFKKLVQSIRALEKGTALPIELEKPALYCNHCGFEYNLTDRVPKITQCNNIVCLKCLKNAQKSINSLNYVCQFHLMEHPIPQMGGFDGMAEPLNIKKEIQLNENKINLQIVQDKLKNYLASKKDVESNLQQKVSNIKNEIDTKIKEIIKNIRVVQSQLHNDLDGFANEVNSSCGTVDVENSIQSLNSKLKEIDSNLKEINSNPSLNTKQIQELSFKVEKDLNKITQEISSDEEKLNSLMSNTQTEGITFDKMDYSYEEIIRRLLIMFKKENTLKQNVSLLKNPSNSIIQDPKWSLVKDKRINNEKFNTLMMMCEFSVNNHLVITDQLGKCLHLVDISSLDYIRSVYDIDTKKGYLSGVCQMQKENVLCVVDKQNCCLYLIDASYKKINECKLEAKKLNKSRDYLDIDYNLDNNKLYLCDSNTNSILIFDNQLRLLKDEQIFGGNGCIQGLKISKNKIFVTDCVQKRVHVLDENLNHLNSFGVSLNYVTDILFSNQFVYLLEYYKKCIQVYDSQKYETIHEIKLDQDKLYKLILIGKKLVVNYSNRELLIYDIQ